MCLCLHVQSMIVCVCVFSHVFVAVGVFGVEEKCADR